MVSEEPLHRCCAKLSDVPAHDAHGMVVVFDAGEAVLRSAVNHGQFADDARFQQQLDGPVHRSPTDGGEIVTDLLCGEPLFFPLEKIDDCPSWGRSAISLVLKDSHEVGTRVE